LSQNRCNCASEVDRLKSEINKEMTQIANAIHSMERSVNENLRAVRESVVAVGGKVHTAGESNVKATTKAGEDLRKRLEELQEALKKQTDAIVQLESVRTYSEARALASKSEKFTGEVDQQFTKAIQNVVANRQRFDAHFNDILNEYDSKLRTIGSHIFDIWEKDLHPTETAARLPSSVHHELSQEVDLERLANRARLLDSDLDMIRTQHLEPLVALDATFERTILTDFAIDGAPPEGREIMVPVAVAIYDTHAEATLDARALPNGQIAQAGRLPEHRAYCESEEGRRRIKSVARLRPLTAEENGLLLQAVERLASRGLLDESLVPGYRKYIEATRINFIESAGTDPEARNA
jgi:hypothetical protein